MDHLASEEYVAVFVNSGGMPKLIDIVKDLSSAEGDMVFKGLMAKKATLCIRSVLNSAVGMDALLDKDCFTDLLSECLSSSFNGLKYQAVEILAAVSLYSKRGRHFALDFLHARAEAPASTHMAGKRWSIVSQFLRPEVPVPTITAIVIMMSTLLKHRSVDGGVFIQNFPCNSTCIFLV